MGWLPTALQGLSWFIARLRRFERVGGLSCKDAPCVLHRGPGRSWPGRHASPGVRVYRVLRVYRTQLRHGLWHAGRGERGTDGAPGSTHDTAGGTALVKKQLPLACDYAMPYHITGWSNDPIGARLSNQTP